MTEPSLFPRDNVLAIAGTHHQYEYMKKTHPEWAHARYVTNQESLEGYRPETVHLLMVGQYWRSEAYDSSTYRVLLSTGATLVVLP